MHATDLARSAPDVHHSSKLAHLLMAKRLKPSWGLLLYVQLVSTKRCSPTSYSTRGSLIIS